METGHITHWAWGAASAMAGSRMVMLFLTLKQNRKCAKTEITKLCIKGVVLLFQNCSKLRTRAVP
jgi:hypothetical protein